jgi:hypothetical protein
MSQSRLNGRGGALAACCSTMPGSALSSRGARKIRLQTNQAFAANLEVYAKLGYAIDRTEPFRGGTMVHMSKRLATPPGRTSAD